VGFLVQGGQGVVAEIGNSMLNWFRGKTASSPQGTGMYRAFCDDGLVLAPTATCLPPSVLDAKRLDDTGLDGLVAQIDDEGLTIAQEEAILIPWDHVYQLLESSDYPSIRGVT
jgi:hypothetical protein